MATRWGRTAEVATIVGAIAAIIALWPIFFPPTPPPPPPPQPPSIPTFDTGWIDGEGKSTPDYCNPRKVALEQQYRDFEIVMTLLPEQHQDNRNAIGIKRDKYRYSCSFAAVRKK